LYRIPVCSQFSPGYPLKHATREREQDRAGRWPEAHSLIRIKPTSTPLVTCIRMFPWVPLPALSCFPAYTSKGRPDLLGGTMDRVLQKACPGRILIPDSPKSVQGITEMHNQNPFQGIYPKDDSRRNFS